MSAQPLPDTGREAPPVPRPAGVIDLASYRGRTAPTPAVPPPPRDASAVPPAPAPPRRRTSSVVQTSPEGEVVVRHVRLSSVFRMTLGFSLCTYLVVIGAGVLIWQAITTLGVVENLESLAEDLGWQEVRFDGPAMLRASAIGGGILVVAATFLSVVFAEIFNLLSTITGGLRAEVGPPPERRRDRRRAAKAEKKAARSAAIS
jgi:hypothetical protein